jgi:protein-S-isoprenylcysteine O-methyltransferase Ste14
VLLADPWWWAFLAAFGWGLCTALVGSRTLGRNLPLGIALVLLAEVPRTVLPLPYGDAYRDFQARVPRLFPRPHSTGP